MTEEELFQMLSSKDYDQLSAALIYVEMKMECPPSPRLIDLLVKLCANNDSDIRAEAVRAAGFYCQLPESIPILNSILKSHEEDELVLNATVHAIAQMCANNSVFRDRGLHMLAKLVLNELMPSDIRNEAYKLVLWRKGKISADTYAKSASSTLVIDTEYVSSLCDSRFESYT